jgi:hypothetical protein
MRPGIDTRPAPALRGALLEPEKSKNGCPPLFGGLYIDDALWRAFTPAQTEFATLIDVQLWAKGWQVLGMFFPDRHPRTRGID